MTDAIDNNTASIETPKDVGVGNPAFARFWTMQLELADKDEDAWRKRARKVCNIYADNDRKKDTEKRAVKFNILYSNVQTLAPALLPSIPQPDVRRRFRDEDPVSGVAADMLERCASTLCDQYDFAHIAKQAVLDRCLPGRAVVRVEYEPTIEDDANGQPKAITDQAVRCRQVHWEDFRRGPGRSWDEVTWVAFKHKLRREDAVSMFGATIGGKLPLNLSPDQTELPKDDDPSIYKRGEVWEIWDKDTRRVIWISKEFKDSALKIEDDKLALQGFFPIPRPLYAIEQPDSLDPVEEFRQYEDQAKELEKITRRIDRITSGLKVRGIAASTIAEFSKVASAGDNEMVAVSSADTMAAMQQGGLDKAIWMWPLETAIKALQELTLQREAIKQTIYEIVGISDILRGSVDPKEKLGQSQLKASWGSRRLDTGREEAQRFLRDLIRLKIEIIAEHFEPQQLMMMSGIKLPTMAEKQQLQQQIQQQAMMAQQQGQQPQPPPDEIKEQLEQPTVEEVMAVIRSDSMRTFRVDVETDQTIVGDEQQEKQIITDFLRGTVEYWTGMGPIIGGGFPMKVAVGLFSAAARRFHLGRDIEDELAALEDAEPPPPPPNPDMIKAQTEAKLAEQDAGIRQQESQQKLQLAQAESQGKLAIAQAESQGKMQIAAQESQAKMAMQAENEKARVANEREIGLKTIEDQTAARRDDYEAKGTPVGQADALKNVAQQFSEAVAAMTQALNMLAAAQMADTVLIKGPDGRPAGARKVMPQGATLQ